MGGRRGGHKPVIDSYSNVEKVGARVLEFYVLKASLNSVYSQGTEGNKRFQISQAIPVLSYSFV